MSTTPTLIPDTVIPDLANSVSIDYAHLDSIWHDALGNPTIIAAARATAADPAALLSTVNAAIVAATQRATRDLIRELARREQRSGETGHAARVRMADYLAEVPPIVSNVTVQTSHFGDTVRGWKLSATVTVRMAEGTRA